MYTLSLENSFKFLLCCHSSARGTARGSWPKLGGSWPKQEGSWPKPGGHDQSQGVMTEAGGAMTGSKGIMAEAGWGHDQS